MLVGLDLLLRAEGGHRPMADEIVQLPHCRSHDPVPLAPRPALLEHRLARPADKQRLEQGLVGLVEEQVAVELPVGRQHAVEHQGDRRLGLLAATERFRRAAEPLELVAQALARRLPGRRFGRSRRRGPGKELVDVFQKPRIGSPPAAKFR